jgi:hypothetical protein
VQVNGKLEGTKQWVERYGVTGDSGTEYVVSKKADGTWGCSCPAWKFHPAPKADCKHIQRVQYDLNFARVIDGAFARQAAPPATTRADPRTAEFEKQRAIPRQERPAPLPPQLASLRVRQFRIA